MRNGAFSPTTAGELLDDPGLEPGGRISFDELATLLGWRPIRVHALFGNMLAD